MEIHQALSALSALAQEKRLEVFRLLVEAGPTGLAVGEIGASVKTAPATLSFHLKELANAGLITARQQGRYIFYSANYPQMRTLIGFLTEKCCIRDNPACATTCAGPADSTQRSEA